MPKVDRTDIAGLHQPDTTAPPVYLSSLTHLTMSSADVYPDYGLTIRQGTYSSSTQLALLIQKADLTALLTVSPTEAVATSGKFFMGNNHFHSGGLDGTQNPPCIFFPDGAAAGMNIWSGSGAPSSSTVGTAKIGDWYFRTDTPTTNNQRIYQCTIAGTPGTWGTRIK